MTGPKDKNVVATDEEESEKESNEEGLSQEEVEERMNEDESDR